jgi:hypothetical protein
VQPTAQKSSGDGGPFRTLLTIGTIAKSARSEIAASTHQACPVKSSAGGALSVDASARSGLAIYATW